MSKPNVPLNFYMTLMEFLMSAKQQVVAAADEFGLTSMQAITLLLTNDSEPRPMSSFCKLFHCDASNITGIVDGLEQKELVSRQEHPSDRRIKVIKLEAEGRKLQTKFLQKLSDSSGFLFDPLSETETKQFVAIIEKLAAVQTTSCPVGLKK
jgi:DNA-binding MarR family transcriptional regulator